MVRKRKQNLNSSYSEGGPRAHRMRTPERRHLNWTGRSMYGSSLPAIELKNEVADERLGWHGEEPAAGGRRDATASARAAWRSWVGEREREVGRRSGRGVGGLRAGIQGRWVGLAGGGLCGGSVSHPRLVMPPRGRKREAGEAVFEEAGNLGVVCGVKGVGGRRLWTQPVSEGVCGWFIPRTCNAQHMNSFIRN